MIEQNGDPDGKIQKMIDARVPTEEKEWRRLYVLQAKTGNIGMDDFGRMKISLPSLSEQTQIVEYLDKQTQKIDSTIEKETQRIELLKEYCQSLISEVVTGKIDVRDYNG